MRNLPRVTSRPSLPAFCFLNESVVLSMPWPRSVTFSTARERPMVNSKTPSLNSMVSPGLALMRAVWVSSWTLGPGLILTTRGAPTVVLVSGEMPLVPQPRMKLVSKTPRNTWRWWEGMDAPLRKEKWLLALGHRGADQYRQSTIAVQRQQPK